MPSSRAERAAFFAGVAVIAILAILLVPAWKSYRDTATDESPAAAAPQPRAVSRPAPAARPARRAVRQPQSPSPPVAPARPKLKLVAVRGDCWMEIRRGTSTGKTLYAATLAKGESVSVTGGRLWIRFGAPQNVDAIIGGRRIEVPTTTTDAVVTAEGVQAAS